MFTRNYILKARKEFKVFPEKCDLCKQWFNHMNYFEPETRTHGMDDIHLCDHCRKQVIIESDSKTTS